MTEKERNLLRLVWCLARGNGGKIDIEKWVFEDYPGDERALLIESTNVATGDRIIEARVVDTASAPDSVPSSR